MSSRSRRGPQADSLEAQVRRASESQLREMASGQLNEDLALALLARRDLSGAVLELLARESGKLKSRAVLIGIVRHPRAPRHVSLPAARHLYTFELMQIALTPETPADVKMFAEEQISNRLSSLSAGERLALARRASTRVAAALLLDADKRVMLAALQNPRLTEVWAVQAILNEDSSADFIESVCRHPKWSLRREVQLALLRNQHTPLARVLQFASGMPTHVLKDVLSQTRLSANVKMYLMQVVEQRERAATAG